MIRKLTRSPQKIPMPTDLGVLGILTDSALAHVLAFLAAVANLPTPEMAPRLHSAGGGRRGSVWAVSLLRVGVLHAWQDEGGHRGPAVGSGGSGTMQGLTLVPFGLGCCVP